MHLCPKLPAWVNPWVAGWFPFILVEAKTPGKGRWQGGSEGAAMSGQVSGEMSPVDSMRVSSTTGAAQSLYGDLVTTGCICKYNTQEGTCFFSKIIHFPKATVLILAILQQSQVSDVLKPTPSESLLGFSGQTRSLCTTLFFSCSYAKLLFLYRLWLSPTLSSVFHRESYILLV